MCSEHFFFSAEVPNSCSCIWPRKVITVPKAGSFGLQLWELWSIFFTQAYFWSMTIIVECKNTNNFDFYLSMNTWTNIDYKWAIKMCHSNDVFLHVNNLAGYWLKTLIFWDSWCGASLWPCLLLPGSPKAVLRSWVRMDESCWGCRGACAPLPSASTGTLCCCSLLWEKRQKEHS